MTEAPHIHIGIDLDNTLIDYGRVFGPVGVELGVLPDGMAGASKAEVRQHLRGLEGGEQTWMRLQGQVYGRFLEQARFMAGAEAALAFMRDAGAKVSIVSHKTKFGHFDEHNVDLREAAVAWLARRNVFDADGFAVSREHVHFLSTRDEKIERIRAIGCQVFIDDLPEVLNDPAFPPATRGIWFSGGQDDLAGEGLEGYRSWDEIRTNVLSAVVLGVAS